MTDTVRSIAALVGGTVAGDGGRTITGVADLRSAGPEHIGFVRDSHFKDLAKDTKAGAVLVQEPLETGATQVVVANPTAAFARVAQHFHPVPTAAEHKVHESALIDPEAKIVEPVEVGPRTVIEAGARLGAGTVVMAGAVVRAGARVGERCVIHPNVVLYPGTTVGDRCILHAGCVIGSDGFGYAPDGNELVKFPQMGTVVVESDVEIGANTAIDRGALGTTRIGAGSKIDNLVQIGHNCVLGKDCALAGNCALSGSTILGDRVRFGGHVVTGGHLTVCDDVNIGGNSVLVRDVTEPGDYMGYPLQRMKDWGRTLNVLGRASEVRHLLKKQRDRDHDGRSQ
ncbi:MAG: UDP-3-O-(3-hydroxymyristoyl)glucosamine N-acyltransferase [Planctomycetota bacterium]|jgi:UDP-3-O-[3-hydroxymyristoyl] glucosamine N-acyltransferase